MTDYKIRPTSWLRRNFAKGNWLSKLSHYEDFYMWRKRRMSNAWRDRIAFNMAELMRTRENGMLPIWRVEMDLWNACNMDCSFCFQSRTTYKSAKIPLYKMSDSLFRKICRELGEMNYSHSLYLSCNFEPTIDPQIIERARIARELVPRAYLLFFTNALSLTEERYHALMKYMSFMFIDNYTNGKKIRPVLAKTMLGMSNEEKHRTVIYMRMQNEVLDTISTNAPSRTKYQSLNIGCTYPFSELYIGADGNCYLCSKDVKYEYPLGNVGLNSIKEVWNSSKSWNYRKTLLNNWRDGPGALKICRTCDFVRSDPDETRAWLPTFDVIPKRLEEMISTS